MNIEDIREDFPLLQKQINGNPLIYFDNACQTLRPNSVINAVVEYYKNYSACGGRSVHKLSETVTEKCEETRRGVAKFINAKRKEEIIFTRNTTEGINLVANSLDFKEGDIVLTTDKEHNSNLICWQILSKKKKIVHEILPSRKDNTFDLERFKRVLSEKNIKLVSMVFTSNLDGVTIPAKEIIEIAHNFGALVFLDAAQTAPHSKINVTDLDVDFLAFSGHKMLGPSGIGILYGKYELLKNLNPFMVGGETVEYSTYYSHKLLPPPEKFEAGLQNFSGIIGLSAAVKYLEQIGFEEIKKQEYQLNKFITENLKRFSQINIIGPKDPSLRGGIISFYVKNISSHELALLLDESSNIMVRSGQHCVHSYFSARKIKDSLRVSLYFYNTLEEAEIFIDSLEKILKIL